MSISDKLAEALHRMNDLLPHRDETSRNDVHELIDSEVATPEAETDQAADGKSDTPIGDQVAKTGE